MVENDRRNENGPLDVGLLVFGAAKGMGTGSERRAGVVERHNRDVDPVDRGAWLEKKRDGRACLGGVIACLKICASDTGNLSDILFLLVPCLVVD